MPGLLDGIPIVDTHVHLTDRKRWTSPAYDWHSCSEKLAHDFTPAMFEEETAGVGLGAALFMECMACKDVPLKEEEAAWAASLASAGTAHITAAIVNCPVGDVPRPEIARHLTHIAHPTIKGIRNLLQGEAPGFGITENYIEGCREVASRGLTIDLCVKGQLDDATELATRVPEGRFILDHIGKPIIKADGSDFDEVWAKKVRALAALPNVWCKVSGVVTEVEGGQWTVAAIEPYIAHVVDCFGWDRVIYGSDWYASKLATEEYKVWLNALLEVKVVAEASKENLTKLFSTNATTFYKL